MNSKHPFPTKRAAVFDLDGTLIDSMPYVIESFCLAVEPFRARPGTEEVLANLGGPLQKCLLNLLGPSGAEHLDQAHAILIGRETGQEFALKPFDGARELLDALQSLNVPIGIWTGRDRWSAERILRVQGLAKYCAATVCGDDLASHKPDPEGLLRVISLMGAEPAHSVFVGDADVDVIGGEAAGVHTVFLHHGRKAPAHVHAAADEVFQNPREAYAAVLRRII